MKEGGEFETGKRSQYNAYDTQLAGMREISCAFLINADDKNAVAFVPYMDSYLNRLESSHRAQNRIDGQRG